MPNTTELLHQLVQRMIRDGEGTALATSIEAMTNLRITEIETEYRSRGFMEFEE